MWATFLVVCEQILGAFSDQAQFQVFNFAHEVQYIPINQSHSQIISKIWRFF